MSEEYKAQLKKLQKYLPLVKKKMEQFKNQTDWQNLENMQIIHDGLVSNNNRLTYKELTQFEKLLKEQFDQKNESPKRRENDAKPMDPKMTEYFSLKGITIAKMQPGNIIDDNIFVLSDSDTEETKNNESNLKSEASTVNTANDSDTYDDNEEESLLVPLKTVPSMEYEKRSNVSYYMPHIKKSLGSGLYKKAEINKIYSNGNSKSKQNTSNNTKKKATGTCETIELISDSDDESKPESVRKTNKLSRTNSAISLNSSKCSVNGKKSQKKKTSQINKSTKTPKGSSPKNLLTNVNFKSSDALRSSIESGKISITTIQNKTSPQATESLLDNNRKRKSRPFQKKIDQEKDREYLPSTDLSLANVQPGAKRWSLRKVRPQKLEEGFTYNDKDFDLMETESNANRSYNAVIPNGTPLVSILKKTYDRTNGSTNQSSQRKENNQHSSINNISDPNCSQLVDDKNDVLKLLPNKTKGLSTSMNVSCNSQLSSSKQKSEIPKNINILHHIQSNFVNYCLLCETYQNRVVEHYVNVHPDSEVFISRLPQDVVDTISSDGIVGFLDNYNSKHILYSANCVFCNKEYKYPLNSWYYHFTMHTGEFSFECSGCGMKKSSFSQAKTHIEKECNLRGKINTIRLFDTESLKIEASICKICNYVQLHQKNITKHLSTEHGVKTNLQLKIKTVTILKICGQYQYNSMSYKLPESNY